MPRRDKGEERRLALERIRKLLRLAEQASSEDSTFADRYVRLARRIGMRYQVSLPPDLRRRVCRSCDALLVPGRTARVRVANGRLSITCLRCRAVRRYPYTRTRRAVA